jgi:hypothetical protein
VAGPAAFGDLSPPAQAPAIASAHAAGPPPAGVELLPAIGPDDDAALRALLRRSVIPGGIRVAFTREPSYAGGEGVAGGHDHLVVARQSGAIVGMGRCSVHRWYLQGQLQPVAYLGELRLADDTPRGARFLRAGFRTLAHAIAGHGVRACITSIATDNHRARTVLEHGRRLGLPTYTPCANLVTLVAPVAHAWWRAAGSGRALARPALPGIDTIADFLDRAARERDLALPWDEGRVRALSAHGVSPHDFVVLERGGRLVAAAALWDQRAFRQVVIDGYGGVLRWTRPVANGVLRLTGRPGLPAPGHVLAQAALLGASVAAPEDWGTLWPLAASVARQKGVQWLAIARDARDPELAVLRPLLRGREYHTTLYHVALDGVPAAPLRDGRLVRPEVGLL